MMSYLKQNFSCVNFMLIKEYRLNNFNNMTNLMRPSFLYKSI